VLDRYAEPQGVGSNAHPMELDELLGYLKNIDNFNLSPWVAVAGQTEAIGDPATPSREQVAILRWLGKSLEIWEKQFPLEGRLAAQVHRLKPLSAALAIVEPWFMQPGAHPLHQLLDNIQARSIGWQSRLDRAGSVLEQQVTKAVDQARSWFDSKYIDLADICNEFTAAAERDQARAQRMVQRIIDTEAGKIRTGAAKQEAARMINLLLEKYPVPEEIGDFVKGPWYTSAQLLHLKFGADSEQWQKMSATTETLLDSLQSQEDVDEERRQHIFAVVSQLPKEMRRWLLSLHHDTEAVNEAMGLVERAHLRILRRQSLELKRAEPIVADGEHISAGDKKIPKAAKHWQEGQWFSVDSEEGVIRAQLVVKVEQSQQLLFANMAGIKVLQLSFAQFDRLLDQNKVKALNSGASFSLCLAYAVGIDSVEIRDALVNALAQAEPVAGPGFETEPELEPEPEPDFAPEPTLEQELELKSPAAGEPEPAEISYALEEIQNPAAQQDNIQFDTEALVDKELPDRQPSASQNIASSSGFLVDQAQEIKTRGGYFAQPAAIQETSSRQLSEPQLRSGTDQGFLSEQAIDASVKRDHASEHDVGNSAYQDSTIAPGPARNRQINLPMGAWLGFHDGEMPLMARLAVHDPEEGFYIFVNRNGVKMRQVTSEEMLRLVDSGMVDILETRSNFRDDVTEVRKNLDQ